MTGADIIIYKHRDKATIIPQTQKGISWIDSELKTLLRPVTIPSELAEEMKEEMERFKLEVEIK